jgi:protocatechuate 3,4-dioxygenase beta subunit
MRVGAEGCLPLAGAIVDVWHCDALGVYSDVADPGFDTSGQKFLRGFQQTDGDGVARFLTIYPGWYPGRTVHIHFKIRSPASDGSVYDFTSQLFFDDSLSDSVFTSSPYAAKGERGTRNQDDGIFRNGENNSCWRRARSPRGTRRRSTSASSSPDRRRSPRASRRRPPGFAAEEWA